MKSRLLVVSLAIAILICASAYGQPVISEKQDVAVFALGYYGWNIPAQVLGSIDSEIQKVFADLGRFTIVGVSQRLSSGGLDQFIATIKKAKQANFVMPDKFQFGEVFLTEGEFNKLIGSFIVVAPVVTEFNSFYNTKSLQYETSLKTSITFIDVASGGTVVAIKSISSTGTDKNNQFKSISAAIESIPGQLEFEIRSIPEFQLKTRILSVSGSKIKLQMGLNMGLKKGDEYSIIQKDSIEGFDNSREAGLVVISEVSQEVSTGEVLYSSIKPTRDTQLKEIARFGTDLDVYVHSVSGAVPTIMPGFRAVASRGFYGFRPYAAVQVPLALMSSYLFWGVIPLDIIPVNAIFGGEFQINMGRLSLTPYAGVGVSYIHVTTAGVSTDTDFLSHIGAQAFAKAAYLFNRNMKVFVDLGFEQWIAISDFWGNASYGGVSLGAGVTFKL